MNLKTRCHTATIIILRIYYCVYYQNSSTFIVLTDTIKNTVSIYEMHMDCNVISTDLNAITCFYRVETD